MKVAIVILSTVVMASSQDRVNIVENAPGQNLGPGYVVDPAFYRPSNPNFGNGPLVDPAFYQPSNPNFGNGPQVDPAFYQNPNPNLGPGEIVDPGFYQPSGPSPYPGYPGSPPTLYPSNPGFPPINTGPAIVDDPPAPHWSQTLYPSPVARDGQN